MFLRPEPILVIELPDDIGEAVTSLSSSIRGQAVVETISDDIFRLLLLIWTRSWTTVQGSKITDPTIQYVALSTLQEDGGFSPPGNVSGTLARFQYCMRLTFLTEMHQSPISSRHVIVSSTGSSRRMSPHSTLYALYSMLPPVSFTPPSALLKSSGQALTMICSYTEGPQSHSGNSLSCSRRMRTRWSRFSKNRFCLDSTFR